MDGYTPKDGVPRDCRDFRSFEDSGWCIHSFGCATRAEKQAFCHSFYVEGKCLGIWDEKGGLRHARQICHWVEAQYGDPQRFNQEEYNEIRRERLQINLMAIENARRDGDLGEG